MLPELLLLPTKPPATAPLLATVTAPVAWEDVTLPLFSPMNPPTVTVPEPVSGAAGV